MTAAAKVRKVPTYCYQCVAGPDLLTVKVVDGVATEVEPNFEAADIHPAAGKVCVKAFGLVQKTYNPNRVLTPMKRTNPRKGKDEDPGFVPISWDEALDTIAAKLNAIKASGNVLDDSGFPRVAASFGGGGTPQSYLGTFPAFLAAWKVIDFSFGSGQGVKCYHSEHLYGELWHRAFTVCPDTPHTKYVVSFGANIEASGGVCGVYRHAEARARGVTRIQVEPHLSVTAGCSAEWVPIKPKTDAAFLFAMMNVMLHERPRQDLDLNFLKHHTASGYLVAPNGFYLRDPESRKPLVWDTIRGAAVPFDTAGIEPALEGAFVASGVEVGADDDVWEHSSTTVSPGFAQFLEHLRPYTPEWAESVCEVPANRIRRIANDYLDHAEVGATVEVDGRVLPYRPVAITLGKTVSNGWGGYECCWARTMIACLVGGLEVPGGTLGTTVRLNRSGFARLSSVRPGADGFMDYPMNATDVEHWKSSPTTRNGYRMLVPLAANTAWSQALGPTHLAWMFVKNPPKGWPQHSLPDVWFIYRTNPAISFWDTPQVSDAMTKFPFVVAFAYTHDETNHMADILLPDATDLESTQLIRVGGTKFIEQFWDYHGFALRQPVVGVRGDARDFSWIATELAERTGLLEPYNAAINRGGAGIPLNGEGWDFRLDETAKHSVEEVWDAVCRAASAEITEGESAEGLDWYKEHGYRVAPFPRLEWYLFPRLVDSGLRFEMPYQERLWRIGVELGRRLHERDIHWWDNQLSEYQAMPKWKDFPGLWEKAVVKAGGKTEDFPFWLLTARSMQYAWGGNVGVQMIREVAENVAGHRGVIINAATAEKLGIEEGDLVEVGSTLRSVTGKAVLRHGIRPDTLLMIGQFGHWATPLAKNFDTPSMNSLTPMDLDLTDATGSGADVVRVFLRKVRR